MRFLLIIMLAVSSNVFTQISDSLPDEDRKDIDELPLKDRFGFFHDKNAIKWSPALGAFGGQDLIMGHSFSFEYGGYGKKYSLNFTVRHHEGFIEYGQTVDLRDSTNIIKGLDPSFRIEVQPRFYYLEDIGLYAGIHLGTIKNLRTSEYTLTGGFTSGLSLVFWKRINLDLSLAIHYDPTGIGSLGDVPVQLRPYAGLGFILPLQVD